MSPFRGSALRRIKLGVVAAGKLFRFPTGSRTGSDRTSENKGKDSFGAAVAAAGKRAFTQACPGCYQLELNATGFATTKIPFPVLARRRLVSLAASWTVRIGDDDTRIRMTRPTGSPEPHLVCN
jgi:hypothetical protein